MLSSYILGNLIGRLLVSYGIVWLGCLALERGNWRRAFTRSKRWPALLVTLVLFVLGIAGTVARAGGLP